MSDGLPQQGEVWLAELDPTRGSEHAGRRPVLVCSTDRLNRAPIGLCIAVPLTTTARDNPLHVVIEPPQGGVRKRSFALPEMVRSLAQSRLARRMGRVDEGTLDAVIQRVRVLLRREP